MGKHVDETRPLSSIFYDRFSTLRPYVLEWDWGFKPHWFGSLRKGRSARWVRVYTDEIGD